jgi:hypothetical protein
MRRIMTSQRYPHILIPRMCEYVRLHAKEENVVDEIKVANQ